MKNVLLKTIYVIVNSLYTLPLMVILLFTDQSKEIDRLFNQFKTNMEESN